MKSPHWWYGLVIVGVSSFVTRLYKVGDPPSVVWDESHFGKMGTYYINRTFFFDIHPPLGKMLIGLSGLLTGYSGNFYFTEPGEDYPENVNYVRMRMVCACVGSVIPLLCFSIVWNLSHSLNASLLAAFLVILDTAILTISRFILLDPYLLFFIMGATWTHVNFGRYRKRHTRQVMIVDRSIYFCNRGFCLHWWLWLAATGIFLGLAMGVKFVGLFVVALVGFDTVNDLWQLLGDLSQSKTQLLQHFLARAACLILLPVIIYLAVFAAHFHILNHSGSGDGFFSSAFQSRLKGNPLYNASMPEDVAYGSVVTLKSHQLGGAYLHSHRHLYPEGVGARQQQVTGYSHKDGNNHWKVKFSHNELNDTTAVVLLRDGDLVRLEHTMTRNNLHSHKVEAPVTRHHYQVTGYGGSNGQGDMNDIFQLQLADGSDTEFRAGVEQAKPVKALESKFRLRHLNTGCILQSNNVVLPKWAFEQHEISCNPHWVDDRSSLWNVEQVFDVRLKNVSFEVMVPTFWESVLESHAVMLQGNSGLKPKDGEVTSVPWQWPLNYRGQSKFYVGDYTIYMLGNPVLWWFCLGALVLFLLWHSICAALRQRQLLHGDIEPPVKSCLWLVFAWSLHYTPFWLMSRVLYFHHYFAAFIYSAMLAAIFTDYVIRKCVSQLGLPRLAETAVTVLILANFAHSFYLFSPLCYGIYGTSTDLTNSNMAGLHWLSTWEF